MPSRDRTGPQGEGPRTGRQAGFCSGSDRPGYNSARSGGLGFGRRAFWHRNPRRWYRGWSSPEEDQDTEKTSLLQEVRELRKQVSRLQEKIDKSDK